MPPTIVESLEFIPSTDPLRKRAWANLELLALSGIWFPAEFRVDSGASLSLLSWEEYGPQGKDLYLDELSARRECEINLPTGGTITREGYTARFRARFRSEPRWIFSWQALFVVTGVPDEAIPLLGIGGTILNDIHITFAGWTRQHPTALSGTVSFDIQIPPNVQLPAISAE